MDQPDLKRMKLPIQRVLGRIRLSDKTVVEISDPKVVENAPALQECFEDFDECKPPVPMNKFTPDQIRFVIDNASKFADDIQNYPKNFQNSPSFNACDGMELDKVLALMDVAFFFNARPLLDGLSMIIRQRVSHLDGEAADKALKEAEGRLQKEPDEQQLGNERKRKLQND